MIEQDPLEPTPKPEGFDAFLAVIQEAIKEQKPIEIGKEDVLALRIGLREAGVNLEVGESEEEKLFSQKQTKFRARAVVDETGKAIGVEVYDRKLPEGERWVSSENFDFGGAGAEGDRTIGVFAMLGKDKFEGLVTWCYEEAVRRGFRRKIGGHEGTEGRGLQQTATDILAIALLDPKTEDFEDRLNGRLSWINRRLWKGLRRELDQKFLDKGIEEPTTKTASFATEALPDLIRFLATPASE